jgi:hypothetical protein
LNGAVCIGLLEYASNQYHIKPEFRTFLDKKHSHYCGGLFAHYGKFTYGLSQYLLDAVRENQSQWSKYNTTVASENLYRDYIYANPQSTQEFLTAMWASGYTDSLELCAKYRFDNYRKLIDLGGATGSFAIASLLQNPLLHAEIMDLEPVKIYAEDTFKKHGVSDRAKFSVGDMLTDHLPQGDIYVLGYVLSDWPDDACIHLIHKCYEQLPKNGLIILLEKSLHEDKTGPYLTAMMNLVMLVEMKGRHRCYSEYMSWMTNAGFGQIETISSSGEKHMLVGMK